MRQLHGFFDELGQAIFHSDARAQIGRQHGPLPGDAFHGDAEFAQGAKLLVLAGFRAQSNESRTQQALQLGIGLLPDGFSEFPNRQRHQISAGGGEQIG